MDSRPSMYDCAAGRVSRRSGQGYASPALAEQPAALLSAAASVTPEALPAARAAMQQHGPLGDALRGNAAFSPFPVGDEVRYQSNPAAPDHRHWVWMLTRRGLHACADLDYAARQLFRKAASEVSTLCCTSFQRQYRDVLHI